MFGVVLGGALVAAGVFSLCCGRTCGHRVMLAHALRRIGATEAQKEQIRSLVLQSRERLGFAKQKVHSLRVELADVLASSSLDSGRLESLEARLFEAVGEGTQVVRQFVTKIHDTLDEKQRVQLASWIRNEHSCHSARCH